MVATKATGTAEAASSFARTTIATLFGLFSITLRSALCGDIVLIGGNSCSKSRVPGNGRALIHATRRTAAVPTARGSTHAHVIPVSIAAKPLRALFVLAFTLCLKLSSGRCKARVLLDWRRTHVARRWTRSTIIVSSCREARIGGFGRSSKVTRRSTFGALSTLGLGRCCGCCEARVLDLRWRAMACGGFDTGSTTFFAFAITLLFFFGKSGKSLVTNDRRRTISTRTASTFSVFTTSGPFLFA
mmetsp:Transcript_20956/g.42774  ORF Transcript_20956/g.42774 Transcript_20956/m.42774 type:complete len:244 (-) Transcript_20956:467-1198(-)